MSEPNNTRRRLPGSSDRPGGAAPIRGLAPTMGHLREDSPRLADWEHVFGSRSIPLKSPLVTQNLGPDDQLHDFYLVDVAALEADQVERLVAHVAQKFELAPEEVKADLAGEHGLPILAADVSVSFDARLVI